MAFRGSNEQFGTHEKLSWVCKVGQRSRGVSDIITIKSSRFNDLPSFFPFSPQKKIHFPSDFLGLFFH